jgi:hypothetical protein
MLKSLPRLNWPVFLTYFVAVPLVWVVLIEGGSYLWNRF